MSSPDDINKNNEKASKETKETPITQDTDAKKDNILEDDKDDSSPRAAYNDEKGDDFFEDDQAQKKGVGILIPLIILLFIICGLLVVGYIYNIAGVRDKLNMYDLDHISKDIQIVTSDDKALPESAILSNDQTTQVKNNSVSPEKHKDDHNPDKISDKKQDNSKDAVIDAETSDQNNQKESPVDKKGKSLTFSKKLIGFTEMDHQNPYALTKEEFTQHKKTIRALNKAIYAGDSYINELVAVKSLFPTLELPAMTEYSAIGKPKKFFLSRIGLDAVKRASILREVKTDAAISDILYAIIRKFVVVTPTSNIDENNLDGRLALIKSAFSNGEFGLALKHIDLLPSDRKAEFEGVIQKINAVTKLKKEMRTIDDALTDKLFKDNKKY